MQTNVIIDKAVGLTALKLYVKNSNLEVGQVTVRHLVFSELITQIRCGKGLEDAEQVFMLCFGNRHTVKEGKGKKEYQSPLLDGYYKDGFGIPCVKISPRLVDLVTEEVKLMEINEENVMAACTDLIIAGRMFQELTIDAAKTMFKVDIPYGEDMMHVKLNSRENEEEEFYVRCDWKYANSSDEEKADIRLTDIRKSIAAGTAKPERIGNVVVVKNENPSKTTYDTIGKQKIWVRHIADYYNCLRNILLAKGVDFANSLMEQEQEIEEKVMSDIAAAMRRPEVKRAYDLSIFFHDVFRTIQSYKTARISQLNKEYPKRSNALEEYVKEVKNETKFAVTILANQIRSEFKKLGLTAVEMIYVLMSNVINEGTNASYAHMVLQDEFVDFVLEINKDNPNVPVWTEDKLMFCTFQEGDVVTFIAGMAAEEDGKEAVADVPLEGTFTIRRNKKGNLVASQLIQDNVRIPDIKDNCLVFVTKPGGGKDWYTSKNLDIVTQDMTKKGAKVTLVPYVKDKDIHDAIVVNNEVIGSFRCSYAISGKPVNSEALNKMYMCKQGTVDHIITANQGDIVGQVAIVTLKDVVTVEVPDIKGNKIEEYKKQQFGEQVDTVDVNLDFLFNSQPVFTNVSSLQTAKTVSEELDIIV